MNQPTLYGHPANGELAFEIPTTNVHRRTWVVGHFNTDGAFVEHAREPGLPEGFVALKGPPSNTEAVDWFFTLAQRLAVNLTAKQVEDARLHDTQYQEIQQWRRASPEVQAAAKSLHRQVPTLRTLWDRTAIEDVPIGAFNVILTVDGLTADLAKIVEAQMAKEG
ncbi:hypothetical protein SEA_VANLEE_86 [Gordonia phage VanLee]|uniref:Uncharacterized protein n=1 Tax=Gordonia phage VanLee TaxID=2845816 RepID=A0A8F2D9Q3_9CAUD|nr:hypothetical protein QEH49_gp086 [Gordonia phage VanLee]QWS68203.1 hypothetical protein SEA_VANLEE_86 [Gordonia phage VanLee]